MQAQTIKPKGIMEMDIMGNTIKASGWGLLFVFIIIMFFIYAKFLHKHTKRIIARRKIKRK